MKKNFLPYGYHWVDAADRKAVERVLKGTWIAQGPKVALFEHELASREGAKYAVVVSSGTAALHIAYLAAGLGRGDEAITSANTFVATSNMLLAAGAKPVFCDIRLDTYNIDEKKIERLITKKTKAIVPVHFAGNPCAMRKIMRIARKRKLLVIWDAAHALGAIYQGKPVGSFGDMAILSFHPVKAITTGEGGAVLTNSKTLAEKLRLLRSHGVVKRELGKNYMVAFGFNYRMSDIQAALGLSQLKKLKKFLRKRKQITAWYEEELGSLQDIALPKETREGSSAWHLYVVRILQPSLRDPLASYLQKRRIAVNFHYPAVVSHPYYQKLGYKKEEAPNALLYERSSLTLPCFPLMERRDVERVARDIRTFFSSQKYSYAYHVRH